MGEDSVDPSTKILAQVGTELYIRGQLQKTSEAGINLARSCWEENSCAGWLRVPGSSHEPRKQQCMSQGIQLVEVAHLREQQNRV